ncbi:MAG: hypothetical protein ACK4MV_13400 [Beijerinckiaceae bacterium]
MTSDDAVIPQYTIDRVIARRARLRRFDRLWPALTARVLANG